MKSDFEDKFRFKCKTRRRRSFQWWQAEFKLWGSTKSWLWCLVPRYHSEKWCFDSDWETSSSLRDFVTSYASFPTLRTKTCAFYGETKCGASKTHYVCREALMMSSSLWILYKCKKLWHRETHFSVRRISWIPATRRWRRSWCPALPSSGCPRGCTCSAQTSCQELHNIWLT